MTDAETYHVVIFKSVHHALRAEKLLKQAVDKKADSLSGIIGIGKGDGSPVARKHDRYLYGRMK